MLPSSSCPLTLALDLSLFPPRLSPRSRSLSLSSLLLFTRSLIPGIVSRCISPRFLLLFPLRLRVPPLRGLKINYKKSPRRELETSFHERRTAEGHVEEGQGEICPPMNFLARGRWPNKRSDISGQNRGSGQVCRGAWSITASRIDNSCQTGST